MTHVTGPIRAQIRAQSQSGCSRWHARAHPPSARGLSAVDLSVSCFDRLGPPTTSHAENRGDLATVGRLQHRAGLCRRPGDDLDTASPCLAVGLGNERKLADWAGADVRSKPSFPATPPRQQRLCLLGPPKNHIKSPHRLDLKRRQCVRVAIERDVDLLVPEHLAHDLWIGASREL